jgi:uncharacterized protein (TIGR02145 family)
MKKLITVFVIVAIYNSVFAQVPQKMSYQCVVRNSAGALVANQSVGIKISILQGSPTGNVAYQETYNPNPQTNANGLVSIEIGTGSVVAGTFSTIDWLASPYFLKTETDPSGGTSYTISATSQLLSVPYALYTSSAGNGFASAYSGSEKRPVLNLTDGNVSLGSAPNSNKLNVNGSVSITPGDNNTWGSALYLDASSLTGGVGYGIYSLSNGAGEGGGKFLIRNDNASSSFLMDNNGHTGINNISPAYGLDVTGDINFTGALLKNGSPFNNSQWITSGSNIFYNSGNVGIGTNSPANPLSVLTGNNLGIYGESTSISGTGIAGHASSVNGANFGVVGTSISRQGTGVFGDATSTEGTTYGVVGRNAGVGGAGVYGYATSTYGVGYGVKGTVASPAGFSGYFTGGKFYVNSEINAVNNKITNVATPVSPSDAATKAYVDNALKELGIIPNNYAGLMSDIDGNTYKTVTIGTQIWMAENLRVVRYNNGTTIPLVTDNTAWAGLTTPGYCWYNNDAATNKTTYGALYNWYTVNTGNLCPTGWHVPTDAEWTTLTTYLNGESVAGGKLKETGTAHWASPNTGATNETGFTALPGGYRNYNGTFNNIGYYGYWWSSTETSTTNAWNRLLNYNFSNVFRDFNNKEFGFSVRCLRDL